MPDFLERLSTALADRYRIERELGAGGMATVYLAEDLKHHRKVALKVLRPELAAAIGTERFLREIETAARLHHPLILPLYDSGEADDFLYYAMPYVEGESLRDRLDRDHQLPVDDALRIASEVADALGHAHSHDVVHRDVKPENILLESGHAVVTDFGISRAISAAGGNRLTETGLSIGTPSYMSPEQAAGESTLDGRSDIYSLGCVLYEMLAGEPPHGGQTAQAIIAKRLTEPAPPIRSVRETVPTEVEKALSRALARVPADRPATASGFAAQLTSSPVTPPSVATPRRVRTVPVAAGLAAAAIVVAVVAVSIGRNAGSGAVERRPTLAVLPFDNLGGPEDDYFADGITEEMTSRLAEISNLGVTSRTSMLRYKGTTRSLREIGVELGVEYVLEGTVRTDRALGRSGAVRVTPQVIRVSDDTHLWTERFTASLAPGEIFAVQAEIAERVAAALDVTLLGSEREALRDVLTHNQEAHDAYLLGRFHWNKRTAQDLERAAEHFSRAVSLDPDFAEAHTGLADTYSLYGYYRVPNVTRAKAYELAESAARRAIEIDGTLAAAHASLANILTYGAWDWEAAEREFQRAIEIDPGYAVARYWYAELLIILGRAREAIVQAQHAVEADPAAIIARHMLAVALELEGRLDQAADQMRAVAALEPDFSFAHFWLALIHLRRGEFDGASREFELLGAPTELVNAVVEAVRDTSTRSRAVAVVAENERRFRQTRPARYDPAIFAQWYALVGAKDSVLVRLEEGIRVGSEQAVFPLRSHLYDGVRSDPRFAALFKTLRLEP